MVASRDGGDTHRGRRRRHLEMVDIMKIGGVAGWMAAMAQAEAGALPLSNTLLSSRVRM